MATTKGKEGVIKIGTVVVGEVKSFDLTETANEVDTSTMGTDWTGVDSTQNSWSASISMFWDEGDAGQELLVIGSKVALKLYPEGSTTGLVEKSGSALITEIGQAQAHDNIVERTVKLKGDGALATAVVA
jgi:hypothetical protein